MLSRRTRTEPRAQTSNKKVKDEVENEKTVEMKQKNEIVKKGERAEALRKLVERYRDLFSQKVLSLIAAGDAQIIDVLGSKMPLPSDVARCEF